jgi:hypothetical protein
MNSALFDLYGDAFIETATDEEIDDLFGRLECIQPPASMVGNIMNAVARLPRHEGVITLCDDTVALAM